MAHVLCTQYLDALEAGSLDQALALFETDAVVDSPLYGTVPVAEFYADLFSDTQRSETRLIEVFTPEQGDRTVALHFAYTWTLKNGSRVEFECVDVFGISPHSNTFSRLKIIYDTAHVRPEFNREAAQT